MFDRLCFFLSIVWRPVTEPTPDEPPMTVWQVWWAYGLDVRTAWEVSGIICGSK